MELIENKSYSSYITKCGDIAQNSTCFRSQCGAIIVKNDTILGEGYNSPPFGECLQSCKKDHLPSDFKSDKTCCLHAEQRAIVDAYENGFNSTDFDGAIMFFARIGNDGKIIPSGRPYCTICSKFWMDVSKNKGKWCLLHSEKTWGILGLYIYKVKEYNDVSFQFKK